MSSVEITIMGPLLSGRGDEIAAKMAEELQQEVSSQALADVQMFLNAQIVHPTPYYETQITQHLIGNEMIVTDRGIIYGPWLEGTSSRNARSRFKGYASFRKAFQLIDGQVARLVEPAVRRALARLS